MSTEVAVEQSLLDLDLTTRLITEAVIVSPVFEEKLAYWLRRNKSPSQKWLMQELIEALGRDRMNLEVGRALANKQETC